MNTLSDKFIETKFDLIIRICMLINLTKYLEISILFKLLNCNKNLSNLTYLLHKNIVYPLSIITHWKKNKHQNIHKLLIDRNFIIKNINLLHSFPKLIYVSFGYSFDQSNFQPITKEVLPNSLTQLTFGNYFNQPITKEVLSNSLTQLKFEYSFNQPITKEVLPNSLIQLTFGSSFNQPITKEVEQLLRHKY